MVKNKKRKKPLPKKKQAKKPESLSRFFDVHTRANHRKISTFKRIVTKQRVYIFFAALTLIIIASTAVYALNNKIDLKSNTTKSTNTTQATFGQDSNSDNNTSLDASPTVNTTEQSATPTCRQIEVTAEAQLLKSTSALTYPHYGDAHSVFDAYNNGYRQAYNTYLNTTRQHNCPITITDRGNVQYSSPVCTQAYADKVVVVLRNQINSVVNLDMNTYIDWKKAGHHSSWDSSYQTYASYQSDIANEQNLIQSQNNDHVRDLVNRTNVELGNLFCPALNPTDFYTHMF